MAAEETTWWSQEYPTYSLSDLQKLGVYRELMKWVNTGNRDRDAYWTKMNLTETTRSIVKRSLDHTHSEALTLEEETWVWERTEKKPEFVLKSVTFRKGEGEWGQILKLFQEFTTEENWAVNNESKSYTKRHVPTRSLPASKRASKSDQFDSNSRFSTEPTPFDQVLSPRNRVSVGGYMNTSNEDMDWDVSEVTSRSVKYAGKWEEERETLTRKSLDAQGVGTVSLESLCDREWDGTIKSLEILERSLGKDFPALSSLWSRLKSLEDSPCLHASDWLQRIHQLRDIQDAANELKITTLAQITGNPEKLDEKKGNFELNETEFEAFFEDFLTAKFKDDLNSFKNRKTPKKLLAFLPLFFHQKDEFPAISSVLSYFSSLKSQGNKKAAILSDLMSVDPAPYLLSLFIVRVKVEFSRLSQGNESAELVDVLNFTSLLFNGEKACSQDAAFALKPDSFTEKSFSPIAQRLRSAAFRTSIAGCRVREEEFLWALMETWRKKVGKNEKKAGEMFDRAEKVAPVTRDSVLSLLHDLDPGLSPSHLHSIQSSLPSVRVTQTHFLSLFHTYPLPPFHTSIFSTFHLVLPELFLVPWPTSI